MTKSDETESFNDLIKSYLDVLGCVESDPFFSVKGFLLLYLKAIWWEINFLAFPFILLINFIILLINLFRKDKVKYRTGIFMRYFLNMYNSFKKGEIPALKLFTAKFLIRLLIQSHIKSRLSQIRKGLSLKELEYDLQGDNDKKINIIKKKKALLKYFDNILPAGIQLKILFSSVATIAGSAAAIYTFIEENLDSKKNLSFEVKNLIPLFNIFWIFSLIASLLSLAVSCFIRKREIFLQYGIFEKEHVLSSELKEQITKEFPYDLSGWIIIFVCSMNANYFLYKNTDDKTTFVIASVILAIPFVYVVYAWFRRIKLNNM